MACKLMLSKVISPLASFRALSRDAQLGPLKTCQRRSASRRRASSEATQASPREEHAAAQAEFFAGEVQPLQQSITPAVDARLAQVAAAVPALGPSSRVLDVGAGTGALIPHLQARGVSDILALDVCPAMLEALEQRFGGGSTLGNEAAVRTWLGDIEAGLPPYQGPFDAVFFNAVFGNLHDPHEALLRACFMLRPGSHIVVSHPLGRLWHEAYRAANQAIVPHLLPAREQLLHMTADLPLSLVEFTDQDNLYIALLRVPDGYAHPAAPIYLSGDITTGFGRGSRQLGVPTANLPPAPLAAQLQALPTGVFFGWAKVDPAPGSPQADAQVHKMVMNVGRRPTFDDGGQPEVSVEVHIMHSFAQEEFYGRPLKVVALGYIRPEVRFAGLPDLLARINTDIGIARAQLDSELWAAYKSDAFFE